MTIKIPQRKLRKSNKKKRKLSKNPLTKHDCKK